MTEQPVKRARAAVSTHGLLIMFLFVTFIFAVLAYRSELADRRIAANQNRIEQIVHSREIALAKRAVIDLKFCTNTQTAFNAIRDVIVTGLRQLEASHPTDPAAQAVRRQQIQTSHDLLAGLQPISCPVDISP